MKINKCNDCGIEFAGDFCPICEKVIEDKEKDSNLNFLEAG